MSTVETGRHMSSALDQADFAQRGLTLEGLTMNEVCGLALVRLHAPPRIALAQANSVALPSETGECLSGDPTLLCLRPGEWLSVSERQSPNSLLSKQRSFAEEFGGSAWDESDGLAVLRLNGAAAVWLLRKNCSLELPVRHADQAWCGRTRLGQISVLMHYHVNGLAQCYDLYIDRSLIRYAWALLDNAAPHAVELWQSHGAKGPERS